ncbi:MAG: translation initiation factor [Candidatus Woesearchaeota archaeon]|nr:translation initiation factor [Candidatus Woesearchaeota archaeon]
MIRSPICSVVGHVDHGKSTLLDFVRGTRIVSKEAGGITQAIGASMVPLDKIKEIAGPLIKTLKIDIKIPGLLFIDTPGHAAFTNLRKRGGNLADISILIVDINEGFMPQTIESLQILKEYKTPFIVAANKVDKLPGFQVKKGMPLLKLIESQQPNVQALLDTKIYELVGKLYEFGFNSERFDRVSDYTKQIAIVPISAMLGVGVPELLVLLIGLAQRYLEQSLKLNLGEEAKGTILEVKDISGLGKVIDVILYDGSLSVGDHIAIATLDEPIITRVKALFLPKPLTEIRENKNKFQSVKKVTASCGVRIVASDLDKCLAGMPLISIKDSSDISEVKERLKADIGEVLFETDKDGILVKADSLGSLEALLTLLRENNIPVRKSGLGNITKKDIIEAKSLKERDELLGVILGFNVGCIDDPQDIEIISDNIIYRIIDRYNEWLEMKKLELRKQILSDLPSLAKIQVLPNYIFRQSNPAIVGIEVLSGVLKKDTPLMKNNGEPVTRVKEIQKDKESVQELPRGEQAAISLIGITIGHQVKKDEVLYTFLTAEQFRRYKEAKDLLEEEQIELLKEIASIMRKKDPTWGF